MQLPEKFIERLQSQFNEDASELIESFNQLSPTSIRINQHKLKEFSGEKIPWCQSGFYLKERPLFTIDPLLHSGCYYVQEASSMFLEQVFTQLFSKEEKITVLDLCASPGGKSTHIASLLSDESVLVSNEVIASRANILKENIIKQGRGSVIVTNSDAKYFSELSEVFDCVVIDAPCSGEGLFRKDNEAVKEWSADQAHFCSIRQQRILEDVIPCLKKNGLLIYSTCTFNPEENEMQLKWLKEKYGFIGVKLKTESSWNIEEWNEDDLYGYRFLSHKIKGEGFFLAVLRKEKSDSAIGNSSNKKFVSWMPELCNEKEISTIKNWTLSTEKSKIYLWKENYFLLSDEQLKMMNELRDCVKIIYAGVELAAKKHNEFIPSPSLALFEQINTFAFNQLDLSREQALSFLRKDSLQISSLGKSWMLAVFENHPLGWVKALGNRMNNYFPVEWRIRNY
ncbi:MAG: rRNA methyltransferase [Bacteroidota bacterium]